MGSRDEEPIRRPPDAGKGYPRPLLEELDTDQLETWLERLDTKIERLEFDRKKIQEELDGRDGGDAE